MSENDLVDITKKASVKRPHVVILGTGASIAAFPEGDRNGRLIPSMANLIEITGVEKTLEEYNIECENGNIEP